MSAMRAQITHFVKDNNGVISAHRPIVVALGEAANTHFAMRKVHERLTDSQIPKGAVSTIITIEHNTAE